MRNLLKSSFAVLAITFLCSTGQAAEEYALTDFTPGGWGVMLSEVLRSLDIVGFLLLTVVLIVIGMAIDLLNSLRVSKLVPDGLLTEVQEEMANGEYERALDLSQKSPSLIGQVFAAALSKTDYSFERMEEAMRGEIEVQGLVWRQWVRQFRIIAILGPVLGLLGVVTNCMRLVADMTGRPNFGLALASSYEMRALIYNIFMALFIGLLLAALSIGVYAYASSKLEKIMAEVRRLGEELLDPFRPLPLPPEE